MKQRKIPWQIDLFTEKNWEFHYTNEQNAKQNNANNIVSPEEIQWKTQQTIDNYNQTFPHSHLEHKQKTDEFHKQIEKTSLNIAQIREKITKSLEGLTLEQQLQFIKDMSLRAEKENFKNSKTQEISSIQDKPKIQETSSIQKKSPQNTKKLNHNTTKEIIIPFQMWTQAFEMKLNKNDDFLNSHQKPQSITLKIRKAWDSRFVTFQVGISLPTFQYVNSKDGSPMVSYQTRGWIHSISRIDKGKSRFYSQNEERISNFWYFRYCFDLHRDIPIHNIITRQIWIHCQNLWISQNPHPYYDK